VSCLHARRTPRTHCRFRQACDNAPRRTAKCSMKRPRTKRIGCGESASYPAAAMAVQISAGIIHRPVLPNIILRKLSTSDHTLPNKPHRFSKTQHHFRCRPGWTSRETFLRSWMRPTWGSTSGCMQSAPCRGSRSVLFLRLSTLSIKESRFPRLYTLSINEIQFCMEP
jgi:hypothetical protein